MKFWGLTLAFVLGAAALFGATAYWYARDCAPLEPANAVEWLRTEFKLSPQQVETIAALHAEQSSRCAEHCLAIQRAHRALRVAREQNQSAAQIEAAQRRLAEADAECRENLERHVRTVAAEMSHDAGQRYLAMVMPRIATYEHVAPPDLSLKPVSSDEHQHAH